MVDGKIKLHRCVNQLKWKGKFVKSCNLKKNKKLKKGIRKKEIPKSSLVNENNDDGFRIIQLNEFAKNMKYKLCNSNLSSIDRISEKHCAANSVFRITCTNCNLINIVNTGKKHEVNEYTYNSLTEKKKKVKCHNDTTTMLVHGKC